MSDSEGRDTAGTQRSPPEPDRDATDRNLAERLAAVERAVTDDGPVADLSTTAERDRLLEDVSTRMEEAEARLDELEAATQALRGYVGSVRAVNEEVERRADLALAVAERTERRLEGTGPDDQQATAESRSTVGADDDDVAAAVGRDAGGDGDASGHTHELAADATVDDPAVAAAVPDGSARSDGTTPHGGGDDADEPNESVLARLRDVL